MIQYNPSFDKKESYSRFIFMMVIAFTAHTVLVAIIVASYRQVVKYNQGLVVELGRQMQFPNEKLGPDKEMQLSEEEQNDESPPEDVAEPEEEVADDPLPERVEPREEIETGIGGLESSREPDDSPSHKKLSARSGDAKQAALARYGGNEDTEAAVARALDWLARHQSLDGRWDMDSYDRQCTDESCQNTGKVIIGTYIYDNGMTGLALLSFLGAGHDDMHGPYKKNVKSAIDFLLSQQFTDGAFVQHTVFHDGEWKQIVTYPMYDHAIALYALAEAYNVRPDERLLNPLQRGLDYLLQYQQAGGGWDYEMNKTGRNDVSISGWAVMALESCRMAGLKVDDELYTRCRRMFRNMTLGSGQVKYTDRNPGKGRRGVGVTAVSLYARLLLGDYKLSSTFQKGLKIITNEPPNWEMKDSEAKQNHTMYYWYYGTLAMFHSGSENWPIWNKFLKSTLLGHQRLTGCSEGSWDPSDPWLGSFAGRVYSTTMGVLSLEIYYRYLPLYQKDIRDTKDMGDSVRKIGNAMDWSITLRDASASERTKKDIFDLIEKDMRDKSTSDNKTQMTDDLTAAVIASLTNSEDTILRFKAIQMLLDYGKGRDQLVACYRASLNGSSVEQTITMINALVNFNALEATPEIMQKLTDKKRKRVQETAYGALISLSGETTIPANYDAWYEWWAQQDKRKFNE